MKIKTADLIGPCILNADLVDMQTDNVEGLTMNYNKFYDAVATDYGPEVALAAVQILTINMTTKTKLKDFKTAGRFTEKIKRKAKDLLWECDPQIIQQAFACWEVSNSWQNRQSLQGMGGCEAKTIKELVDENQNC